MDGMLSWHRQPTQHQGLPHATLGLLTCSAASAAAAAAPLGQREMQHPGQAPAHLREREARQGGCADGQHWQGLRVNVGKLWVALHWCSVSILLTVAGSIACRLLCGLPHVQGRPQRVAAGGPACRKRRCWLLAAAGGGRRWTQAADRGHAAALVLLSSAAGVGARLAGAWQVGCPKAPQRGTKALAEIRNRDQGFRRMLTPGRQVGRRDVFAPAVGKAPHFSLPGRLPRIPLHWILTLYCTGKFQRAGSTIDTLPALPAPHLLRLAFRL